MRNGRLEEFTVVSGSDARMVRRSPFDPKKDELIKRMIVAGKQPDAYVIVPDEYVRSKNGNVNIESHFYDWAKRNGLALHCKVHKNGVQAQARIIPRAMSIAPPPSGGGDRRRRGETVVQTTVVR